MKTQNTFKKMVEKADGMVSSGIPETVVLGNIKFTTKWRGGVWANFLTKWAERKEIMELLNEVPALSDTSDTKKTKSKKRGGNTPFVIKNDANEPILTIYNTVIYKRNWHGKNAPKWRTSTDENSGYEYEVSDSDGILAEGTYNSCRAYLLLCKKIVVLHKILDAQKNAQKKDKNKKFRDSRVPELSQEIVEFSNQIKYGRSLWVVNAAFRITAAVNKAKKRAEAKAQKEAAEKRSAAKMWVYGELSAILHKLSEGVSFIDLKKRFDAAVEVAEKHNLNFSKPIEMIQQAALGFGTYQNLPELENIDHEQIEELAVA